MFASCAREFESCVAMCGERKGRKDRDSRKGFGGKGNGSDMKHAAVGPEEQRRWQTTCRNEKTNIKLDPVKSKLRRIRSESDRIGKVLRFEGAHGPLGLRAPSTTLLCSRPVLLY